MTLSARCNNLMLWFVCFILATMPVIFGAVHPITLGWYVFVVFVVFGGWLCFTITGCNISGSGNFWIYPLVAVLLYVAFQSVPLPMSLLEVLSSARALRVEQVNTLAGTQQNFAPLSESGFLSLSMVVLFVALLIYFQAVRLLLYRHERAVRFIVFVIIGVGFVEALYGLLQFLNPQIGLLWLSLKNRAATGTIIYKNQYASLLNMCWPFAFAYAIVCLSKTKHSVLKKYKKAKKGKRREIAVYHAGYAPFFFFAAGVMLLAILFSLSRGGIIAMIFVLFLLYYLLPLSGKFKLYSLAVISSFLLAYGSLLGFDNVINRFSSIGMSGISRWDIYAASMPMLLDHFFTGVGLDSYKFLSFVYLKGLPAMAHYDCAHNEFLQLTIELGVPVALLFFTWLFAAMFYSLRTIKRRVTRVERSDMLNLMLGIAAFCGLAGFLVHGFVDFGWRLPANLFYATTLAALLSHSISSHRRYC